MAAMACKSGLVSGVPNAFGIQPSATSQFLAHRCSSSRIGSKSTYQVLRGERIRCPCRNLLGRAPVQDVSDRSLTTPQFSSDTPLTVSSVIRAPVMTQNMGSLDRILRTLAALVVGVLYATGTLGGTTALVLGVVAVAFLLTSFVGTCPLYFPIGLSTRREQRT